MKKTILLTALAATAGLAAAQDMGKVLSSTAIITQVGVPRQICTTQTVPVQSQKSGAGAVMGALAGGAIGNSVGGGDGRVIATMIGLVGGALLGDKIEGSPPAQTQNAQSCSTQTFYENRTTGYNVVYEYAGKQYQVQMPNDPGPFVRLQIAPVVTQPQAPISGNTTYIQPEMAQPLQSVLPVESIQSVQSVVTQHVFTQPVIVTAAPLAYVAYPGYYDRPYYPPVGVNLDFGWSNNRHGHGGNRHWR